MQENYDELLKELTDSFGEDIISTDDLPYIIMYLYEPDGSRRELHFWK